MFRYYLSLMLLSRLVFVIKNSFYSWNCRVFNDMISKIMTQNMTAKKKSPETGTFAKQDTGVEPASSAWEADVLPMY